MSDVPHYAGRVGRAVTRGRRHLIRAAVALARALPARSSGAVAGPTEAVTDTATVEGMRRGVGYLYRSSEKMRISSALYLFKDDRWTVFQAPVAAAQ